MPIKFTRQANESFVESGDLRVGTRTVTTLVNGKPSIAPPRNAKEQLKFIREALLKGISVPAQTYELREADVDAPELVARRTAQLVKARKKKAGDEDDIQD